MTLRTITHINLLAQAVDDPGGVFSGQPIENIRQLRIPGDLIIGGVFPVHAKGSGGISPCGEIFETRGVHRVEAFLYALDMGALILDSCSNPAYALNQSLDFVREMIGGSSSVISEYKCNDGKQPKLLHNSIPKKSVVAVVGASYSSVTVQIANLLRLFRIVQVSPASTNADLSDKNRFEYFARTVPSDNYQARAMIDIAVHFNWTYVSLVYSADEYGELGADAFKKEARRAKICIAIEERVSMKPESLRDSIDNLIKKLQQDKQVGARIVALFVGTEYVPDLLQKASERMGEDYKRKRIIWLASEGWDRNNEYYTLGSRKLAAEGAIVLMLESQRVPTFEEYYLSLHPGNENFERNKWLRELWKHKFNCEFDLPLESKLNKCEAQRQSADNFSADDKVQFVIEAVYAIAHALQAMKENVCPDDSIESSWISRYARLPQIWLGKRVHFSPQDELCCWACGKCEDYEYLINETSCADCGKGNWPTESRTSCFSLADKHLKHMRWNTWYSIVPTALAIIGILTTIVVLLIYTIYADTPVVKASGRELSHVLLCSCLVCYSMTFILLSKPDPFVCTIKRLGIGLAFSCLYSALLVKTNRIYRIFSQATRSRRPPPMISPISQLALTAAFVGSKQIFTLVWLIIQPPGTQHIYPTRADVVLACNVPDHHFLYSLAYEAILLILCTVYAIKTRKVPENFNETRYIGFSMYTTCVLWCCLILFFIGTSSDFQALVCIFSPKIYIILFEKHKNVRKEAVGSIMQKRQEASVGSYYVINAISEVGVGRGEVNKNFISERLSSPSPTVHTALLACHRKSSSSCYKYTSGSPRQTSLSNASSTAHDTFL
ncbi:G_PROTEIN_RECEP_F3_4 domain-containing protein [Meloidogyne graminicola]|uniref:G_PROTEIN_RECEP_F3_4 domain-containing protein n=1 Tax=Meloidogyne graminicola TaxID=189291 RepID=A0A8S9ZXA1_9BILA|nr:G_PROTEIN_RECEP_F3_4 domain-containing protein [Meloidogyne graminicola]